MNPRPPLTGGSARREVTGEGDHHATRSAHSDRASLTPNRRSSFLWRLSALASYLDGLYVGEAHIAVGKRPARPPLDSPARRPAGGSPEPVVPLIERDSFR